MSIPFSGPTRIIRGLTCIVAKNGVKINRVNGTFNVSNTFNPNAETRTNRIYHEITLEHDGRVTASQLAVLFAPLAKKPGQFLFADYDNSGADIPLILIDDYGNKAVYHKAALTRMTGITLGYEQPFGSMTFMCLCSSTAVPSDANSLVTESTGATVPGWADDYTLDAGVYSINNPYRKSHIPTEAYSAVWALDGTPITGFNGFYGETGIKVDIGMQTKETMDPQRGLLDMQIQSFSASVSMTPVHGPTVAQMMTALKNQGSGAGLGRPLTAEGLTLTLTGTRMIITLNCAGLENDGLNYSTGEIRQGEARWVGGSSISEEDGTVSNPISVVLND